MKNILGLAAAASIVCVLPVSAHHSHANYAQDRTINLSGQVTEVHWMDPHTWLYIEVAGAQGQKIVWPLEGTGTAGLMRKGWNRDSIKVRDNISVRCHPLRDGAHGCLLGFITAINGVAMDKEYN